LQKIRETLKIKQNKQILDNIDKTAVDPRSVHKYNHPYTESYCPNFKKKNLKKKKKKKKKKKQIDITFQHSSTTRVKKAIFPFSVCTTRGFVTWSLVPRPPHAKFSVSRAAIVEDTPFRPKSN
jgi:hypothetical protein